MVAIALRWAFWLTAVLVLVLAPLAWAPIQIFPAAWGWFAVSFPEYAAISWRNGGNLIAQLGSFWIAIEPYRAGIFAAMFLAATAGVFAGGATARFCCGLFYYTGWALVVYLLNQLSYLLWQTLEGGAAVVFAAWPQLYDFFQAQHQRWANTLGPTGMAATYFFLVAAVITYGWASLELVREGLRQFREWLQSAFIGQVDPVFPRASLRTAEACAKARRQAINAYLHRHTLPPTHTQITFSNRLVREYVERRQEIEPVDPLRVVAFLEVPRGSPIIANPTRLDSAEEVAGQYARLKFEAERTSASGDAALEDTLVLLLGRVVDAAILADQHLDAQREDKTWPSMPFFERIYVEHRPILPPFDCFLGPLLGDALPARVVIETQYPDVFRKALHGGKGKYGQFRNWFGIGIQIEAPNLSQNLLSRFWRVVGGKSTPLKIERRPWFSAQVVCRRLKSRVTGGVSGELKLDLTAPAPDVGQPPQRSESVWHVMSSGPLADGCPSALSTLRGEPPIAARGGISNAPAMWLLPPRGHMDKSCMNICAQSLPSDKATISVDLANVGTVHSAPGDIPKWLKGPAAVGGLRRRAWVGAFFDRELRQGNRFPLAACAKRFGEGAGLPGTRADLRGAFANVWRSEGLGGVFVAVQGPEHASNLLLPEPLLNDYITDLPAASAIAATLPQTDDPPFVPSPELKRAR